jgi:peptidoglycan/LPS O-acetylase OafA/YrhL
MYQHTKIERFYSLDVLRGIASLSIVLWHWQHFFYSGTNPGTIDTARLPLANWLLPLYLKGGGAVDLFFILSGFIFYWLYSQRIAGGLFSLGRFALLRFSRLYPLHLVTLLIVALSQFWLLSSKGSFFVYPNNDIKHFLLNLLFASSWGFEIGQSFNGPIWSVSIEVLVYSLFFAYCRLLPTKIIGLFIISAIGFKFVQEFNVYVGRGIGSFFLGGCVFLVYQAIVNSRHFVVATKLAASLLCVAWAITFIVILDGVDLNSISVSSVTFLWRFEPLLKWIIHTFSSRWSVVVLFPLTIMALALIETFRGTLGKRVSFIGDISYSSYLLHFPLQLLFSVLVTRLALDDSVYYSPLFMGVFFAMLLFLCLASYHCLEMPSQRFLRQLGRTGVGHRIRR